MGRPLAVVAAVLVGVLGGCGGESGSGGGGGDYGAAAAVIPPVPPPEPQLGQESVTQAAAASGAVDLATQAATGVILDGYTQGEATGANHVFLSPPVWQYSASFDWELDLDSAGRSGNDRFPFVSGLLLISADATFDGNWLAGDATYQLTLTAGSDITSEDPSSGIETVIPEGSTWTYELAVTWEVTDSQNWSVTSTSTKAVAVEGLVVTDGDSVLTVDVSGGREAVCAIAKIDGVVVKERTISGSFTVVIDDGSGAVEVLIEFDNDGLITVTVGDDVFGPFTPQEFLEFFEVEFV